MALTETNDARGFVAETGWSEWKHDSDKFLTILAWNGTQNRMQNRL